MKRFLLFLGDIAVLYLSLILVLWLRYGSDFYGELLERHLTPFTALFPLWLLTFYVTGLYDLRELRNGLEFLRILGTAILVNTVLSVAFFYLLPISEIAPKTNLLLFIAVFILLEMIWRRSFNRLAKNWQPLRMAIIGQGGAVIELRTFIGQNPQLGYEIALDFPDERSLPSFEDRETWRRTIREHGLELIVVPGNFFRKEKFTKNFFRLLNLGIEVRDFPSFYESVFRRIPLSDIDEEWFLKYVGSRRLVYSHAKRFLEFTLALLILALFLPLWLLIGLLTKLSSSGPAIYRQVRMGQFGRRFTLYKFRTMREDAEKDGPQWAAVKDDRSTWVGQVLRFTHLDELPQMWNIMKGQLSFVGPRPERPEFVEILRKEVPYYETRLLVKPGLTGWAQIHHRKDATVEDVTRKIQFDLYYLKNRSMILDLAILLKTLRLFVSNPK